MESESALVINFPTEGLYFKSSDGVVHFELRKTVAEPMAFKVLSKFPQIYRVHPNFGVIEGPVGRTKSVSVSLDVSHVATKKEVTGMANDVLLIDTIGVNEVGQNDAPAPPAKKANKSAQAFDWSKVEDRSRVNTLRLRSKFDLSLKTQLLKELAEKEEQSKEAQTKTEEAEKMPEEVPVSNESQNEAVMEEPNPVEEPKTMEVETKEISQQVVEENVNYVDVTTGEMTLVSEQKEKKFPEMPSAPDLASFLEEIRKIDAKAVMANRAIRVLRTNANERGLPPLFSIIDKVYTAAQYRNAVRHGEQLASIDD